MAEALPAEVTLLSPMLREALVARLRGAVDSEWNMFGGKPAVGRVWDDRLRLRKRIGYRNSFQIILRAELEPQGRGTLLRCRLGPYPLVRIAHGFWMVVALLFAAMILPAALLGAGDITVMPVVVALVMPAFGAALWVFGRWLARGEDAWLLDWLRQEVGAVRIS